jgi:hypothetical protein
MHSLGKRLNAASGSVMLAVIIARGVVLDMGITVMVVNDRKQQAVHPCAKIFIPEPTRLLLFSVQVREQQIERHIFKADEATESVMRDSMYRTVDSALVSRHIQIVYLSRTEMKIRLQV